MAFVLRVLLVIGSVSTFLYILRKIKRSHIQIDYAIFWSLISFVFVVMSIFPQPVKWVSNLMGFQSQSNLVFLSVIFLLLVKNFTNSIKISQQNQKIVALVQHIAIEEKEAFDLKYLNKKK